VGAQALLVGFAIDGKRSSPDRVIDSQASPGLFVVADEFLDNRDLFSVLGMEGWVDPGGPIVGLIAEVVDVEFDDFKSGDVCSKFVQSPGVFGLKFWALGKVLRNER